MLANCIIGISVGCWLIASRLPTGCCVDADFDFSFRASDSGGSNDVVVVFEGDTAVLTCSTDPSMAVDFLFTSAKPSPPSSYGALTATADDGRVLIANGSLSDDRQRRLSIETKTKLISRHELVMRNVRVNDSGVYRCKSGNQLSNGLLGQPIKLQVKQRSNVGRGKDGAVDQWRQLFLKLLVVFLVTLIAFLFLQWRLTTFRSNLPNMQVSKKNVFKAFSELPPWKPMSQTWFQRSDLAELLIGFGTHPVVAVAICARVHPRKVGIGTSLKSILFGKPLVVLTAVYYAILGLVATLIVPDSLKFVASKTEEIIESVQELSGDELALAFGHYVDFKLLTVLTLIFAVALASQLCLFLTTGLFASFLACCGSEQQYVNNDDHRHHAANQRPLALIPNAASHLLRHDDQADDVIE